MAFSGQRCVFEIHVKSQEFLAIYSLEIGWLFFAIHKLLVNSMQK